MKIVFKVATQSFPDLHFPWLGEASLSLSTEMPGPALQQILLCCTIKIKLQREVKLWLTPLITEPLKTIYSSLPNKNLGKFPTSSQVSFREMRMVLFYMPSMRSTARSQHKESQQAS